MKLEIVRRDFAKIDDKWFELEDLNKRGLTADRAWSSFRAFFRAGEPEILAANVRKHVTPATDRNRGVSHGQRRMGLGGVLPSRSCASATGHAEKS